VKRNQADKVFVVTCSNCGRSQHEARLMPQATASVVLCDTCIRLFHDIVIEEENAALEARKPQPRCEPYSTL